jgi:hypothetical protein
VDVNDPRIQAALAGAHPPVGDKSKPDDKKPKDGEGK